MTSYYMKTVDGIPTGFPMEKPSVVTLPGGATVGSIGWSDADLIEHALIYPCHDGYDPRIHVALGGGEFVDDKIMINKEFRPIHDIQTEVISRLKIDCQQAIVSRWTPFDIACCALGVYGQTEVDECRDFITNANREMKRLELEALSSTDHTFIANIVFNLPA